MKKKITAILLALSMASSMVMPAMAVETAATETEAEAAGEEETAEKAEEEEAAPQSAEAAAENDTADTEEAVPEAVAAGTVEAPTEESASAEETDVTGPASEEPEEKDTPDKAAAAGSQEEIQGEESSEPAAEEAPSAGEDIVEEAVSEEEGNESSDFILRREDEETGIRYTETSMTIMVGELEDAGLFPTSGYSDKIGGYVIRWESSDKNIMRMTGNSARAYSVGTCEITGTAVSRERKEYPYAKFFYTVCGDVEDIDIPEYIDLEVGQTLIYKEIKTTPKYIEIDNYKTVIPDDEKEYVDASLNPTQLGGCPVNLSCKFIGKKAGKATVFIELWRSGKMFRKKITVNVGRKAIMWTLHKSSISLNKGSRAALKIFSNIEYEAKDVKWVSKDRNIATVDKDGYVTAVAPGTTTVLCYLSSNPNIMAQCKVTVKILVNSIKLNRSSASMLVGKTLQLTKTISPAATTNKNVTWKSSNTKVATVDQNGKIKAVRRGTATITCTANDSGRESASCTVTVSIPVKKITLSKTSATVKKGKSFNLTAAVAPTTAGNRNVKWITSNSSVVSVTQTGRVTAKGKGKATITCVAKDGSGVKASCVITVK